MKIKLKKFTVVYLSGSWTPAVTAIVILLACVIAECAKWYMLGVALLCTFAVSLLGIVASSVICFAKKQWLQGSIRLATLLVTIIVSIIVIFVTMFFSLFGSSDDDFANNITIPSNISVSKPYTMHDDLNMEDSVHPSPKDGFQCCLMQSLEKQGADDSTIKADIPSLFDLHKHHPLILKRYLACSPAWRVFEEHGQKYAARRWMVGSHWHYELHGYYSNFSVGFQSGTTLGLSGETWERATQHLKPGQTCNLDISEGNNLNNSHCAVKGDGLVVELFEGSAKRERRLTKAALVYLENEFHGLLVSPKWSTIEKAINPVVSPPPGPTLRLWNEFQPGIYEPEVWANPGEPGMVYLKAYEVTQNTRLSDKKLREDSSEWIGWSNNPKQLFLSNTQITIYEGDWGKPYAARFEVWFVPDSGKPERKLMQRVFKIEGWQR